MNTGRCWHFLCPDPDPGPPAPKAGSDGRGLPVWRKKQRQTRLLLVRTMYFKPRKSRNSERLDSLPALPSTDTTPLPFNGGRPWLGWRGAVWGCSPSQQGRGRPAPGSGSRLLPARNACEGRAGMVAGAVPLAGGSPGSVATREDAGLTTRQGQQAPARHLPRPRVEVHATGQDTSGCKGRRL